MGISIQNVETGETDYFYCDLNTITPQKYDEETGEPLNGQFKVRYVKHNRFQIPKKYIRLTGCEEFDKRMTGEYEERIEPSCVAVNPNAVEKKPRKQHYNRDDYINMEGVKNEIILGYNKENYRLFLIPSLFCFNYYFAVFLILMETLLHIFAHKRNALNMNKNVYYRSPLHMLTAHFCARCRAESGAELKIFDNWYKQMRATRAAKRLKDVTKAIS